MAFAVLFGLLFTVQLHLAKALERQGIEIFDQIRARLKKEELEGEGGLKKPAIYVVGLVLNNTVVFYQVFSAGLAGDASAPVFSSMFGVGLVALMLYSHFVLREGVSRPEWVGSAVLVAGTVVAGVEGATREAVEYVESDVGHYFLVVAVLLAALGVAWSFSIKTRSGTGLAFGLFAGACGGLDVATKALGQGLGQEGAGLLPTTPLGWAIFVGSFAPATTAFLVTQWGFARKAKASRLVPAYNSTYVVVPLAVQVLVKPAYVVTWTTALAVCLVVAGIVLATAFKPDAGPEEGPERGLEAEPGVTPRT